MNSVWHAETGTTAMLQLLDRWVALGWLRELDRAFARFLVSESLEEDPAVILAAALVSHQLGRGHVCLDLVAALQEPEAVLAMLLEPNEDPGAPLETCLPARVLASLDLTGWSERLVLSGLVGQGEGNTPLVLADHRLYLRRYWRHERQIEVALKARMARRAEVTEALPMSRFREMLTALFPLKSISATTPQGRPDWQKIACALAARSAFCVVTGGPGTGKTTTVVRLLALLQSMALETQGLSAGTLRIRLAAPTGKAAARLRESITKAIDNLPDEVLKLPGLKACIPSEVTTLHRLLGTRPGTRRFRHDADHPLPLDVLVVDEASMIDLEMMAAVLHALPAEARLILLGDKDQLASVEAGSVLGGLCCRASAAHYLPETVAWLDDLCHVVIDKALQDESGTILDQHVVMLRDSHRFTLESGIGQLAAAVNEGNVDAIRQIQQIGRQGYRDLVRVDLNDLEDDRLEASLLGGDGLSSGHPGAPRLKDYLLLVLRQRPALEADHAAFDDWARGILQMHARFQLLCALRHGDYGVAGLNARIEQMLIRHGLIRRDAGSLYDDSWYEGRPVIVTRNDYALGLMNGDMGVTLSRPVRNTRTGALRWERRVAFMRNDGDGGVYWVLPSRLTSVDTVYALTVHKSQGSEFEHCVLLLPPQSNALLTRELVYTGITRASRLFTQISVDGGRSMIAATGVTVRRSGGLRLWDSDSAK